MFHSPEFWAPEAYRAKVKTPFEFVVSALRATDADVDRSAAVAERAQHHGHADLRHAAAHRILHQAPTPG